MKRTGLVKTLLLVLPLLASAVAAVPGTVQVFSETESQAYSYLMTAPFETVGIVGLCAPLAAVLNYITIVCMVLGLLIRKDTPLKGGAVLAFCSSLMAVLPLFALTAKIKVVPHVLFPILTLAAAVLGYTYLKKKKADPEMPRGKRLETH